MCLDIDSEYDDQAADDYSHPKFIGVTWNQFERLPMIQDEKMDQRLSQPSNGGEYETDYKKRLSRLTK
jgi:hypothetical protein